MVDPKNRWMIVWTAAGALATAGGVVATVLVARAPADKPAASTATTITVATTTTTTIVATTPSATSTTSSQREATTSPKTNHTGSLADREDRLREHLTGVFTSCEPRRNLDLATDFFAALDCVAATAGPSSKPLVIQFADATAMSDFYTKERKGVDSNGNCAQGQEYFGTWRGSDGTVTGKSVCTQGSTTFRIYWGYDRENIGIVAEGLNAWSLYQWWSAYGSRAVG